MCFEVSMYTISSGPQAPEIIVMETKEVMITTAMVMTVTMATKQTYMAKRLLARWLVNTY